MKMGVGAKNLITDVSGLRCGHAEDIAAGTGVSVILPDEAAVAACSIGGGAPGTLGSDVLAASNIIDKIDGLFLSGGSAYGLASGAGMTDYLGSQGIGFTFGETQDNVMPVPIIAGAILFDLNNQCEKWNNQAPYYQLAQKAVKNASKESFALGNVGAGLGAVAGSVKGGLGSASYITEDGFELGALVAVNSFGSVINPKTKKLWAADFELNGEMGNISPQTTTNNDIFAESKISPRLRSNTVIAICALNAVLTKDQAQRLAIMAQDGIARACRPSHTIFDGDSCFVISTGKQEIDGALKPLILTQLGGILTDCLTRAIGRAIYETKSLHQSISYREAFSL